MSSVSSGIEALGCLCATDSSSLQTPLWIDDLASSKCSWLLVALVGGEEVDRDRLCPVRKVDVAGGAEAPRRAPCEGPTCGESGWTAMVGERALRHCTRCTKSSEKGMNLKTSKVQKE